MTIRCIYQDEPNFPATDQHPDAVRYQVGCYWVDAVGGEPTEAEVLAITNPSSPSDFPISMRQLRLTLLGAGKPVTFIQDTIDTIADPIQKAAAQIWYEETSVVHWDHPETQALIALSKIPEDQAKALWLAAKDLAA